MLRRRARTQEGIVEYLVRMPLCLSRIGQCRQPLLPTRSFGRISRRGCQALRAPRRWAGQWTGERPFGCQVPHASRRDGRAGCLPILARSCFRRWSMPAGTRTGPTLMKAADCKNRARRHRLRLKLAPAVTAIAKVVRSGSTAQIGMQPAYRARLSFFQLVCRLPSRQDASLAAKIDLALQCRSGRPGPGQSRDFISLAQTLSFGRSSLRIEFR